MKPPRLSILSSALLLLMTVAASCPPQPNGDLANEEFVINTTVSIAVAVVVDNAQKHGDDLVPYFKVAADLIEMSTTTNTSPSTVMVMVHSLGGNMPEELAVMVGVSSVQAYVAQHPEAMANGDAITLMRLVAMDIRLGLPPATPDSIRGFVDKLKKAHANRK